MFTQRRAWLLAIAAIAALAIALAAACSGSSDSPADAPTVTSNPTLSGLIITLNRNGCAWGCQWGYELTIRGDGSVEYEGTGQLNVVGPATGTITQAQVRMLSDRFDEIGFADLEGITCRVSDIPYTNLTLIREPRLERTVEFCNLLCDQTPEDPATTLDEVEFFDFCQYHFEPALEDLADFIDEIPDSQRWTGDTE